MNWDPPQVETDRDWAALARQWWWVPIVGVLSVFAAIVMITHEPEGSEPDIHPAIKTSTDAMRADGDCRGLQDAFDRHDEADVLAYIDDALRDAGCYD